MTKQEAANKIIEQQGHCGGIKCWECPLSHEGEHASCDGVDDAAVVAKEWLRKEKNKMRKYAIIIGENNEDLSEEVQRALFAVGLKWVASGEKVSHESLPIIYLESDGMHGAGSTMGHLSGDEYEKIWPSYVLKHATKLDGAIKPDEQVVIDGKEFSLSTIKAALKAHTSFED